MGNNSFVKLLKELNTVVFDDCLFNLDEYDLSEIFNTGNKIYYGNSTAINSDDIGNAINQAIENSKATMNGEYIIWLHIRGKAGLTDVDTACGYVHDHYNMDPIISSVLDANMGDLIEIFVIVSQDE